MKSKLMMKEKIRGVRNYIYLYGLNFLLFLVFWGTMLKKNFNADTIFHMVVEDADVLTRIRAGRYVMALGDYVLLQLGVRTTTNLSITMLATFILFALAMTVIYNVFERWSPEENWNKAGYYIGIELVFLNVLFVELLMFGQDSLYFALAYLMAVLAVRQFSKRKYISMVCFLIIAVTTYQYTMIFAAILLAVYICMEHQCKLSLKAVKEEMLAILCCLGFGVLDYLSMFFLEKGNIISSFSKKAEMGNIGVKLKDILLSFVELHKNSAGILPDLWIPFFFTMALWGIILLSCIKKHMLNKVIFIFAIWLGGDLLLYVIPFLHKELYFPPRMAFCFYLVQGCMVLIAYMLSSGKIRQLLTRGCVGYLVIHMCFADFVVVNRFVSNTLDEVYVNMMFQEVLKYEEKTGIQVTKIAFIDDAYAPDSYPEINYVSGQINERSLGTVTQSCVRVFTGRNLEIVEMSKKIYSEFFEGRNWDYFDASEQVVFDGDTVYWCIF